MAHPDPMDPAPVLPDCRLSELLAASPRRPCVMVARMALEREPLLLDVPARQGEAAAISGLSDDGAVDRDVPSQHDALVPDSAGEADPVVLEHLDVLVNDRPGRHPGGCVTTRRPAGQEQANILKLA